ncbi:MAG: RluA family pseudouridine synthase [Alphaproteobacteria bacterium]|nr:RluA family pseudouridine synthase [Alphaproteobacteria bacterium]
MTVRDWIIYEDRAVVAVAKPPGLAAQGGGGVAESLDVLLGELSRNPRTTPRLAHRLDRETSGVIVAGRTRTATAALSAAFAERRVEKTYLALVCGGAPEPADGRIDAPLVRTRTGRVDVVRVARPGEQGAQAAATAYATRAATAHAALVEAAPETGRMHQIRIHLAALGRPIFGDGKYGGLFRIGAVTAPRVMLHALALAVPHPDGGVLRLHAPPPEDFRAAAQALDLAAGLGASFPPPSREPPP